jgi:hypothetical protein
MSSCDSVKSDLATSGATVLENNGGSGEDPGTCDTIITDFGNNIK